MRSRRQQISPWSDAVESVAHLDAEALSTTLARTSRLVVRSIRAGDPCSATQHLLILRAKTEQLLEALAGELEDRREQPHLSLLLSQLDAAGQAAEHAKAEALIAAIYECCDTKRPSKSRDGCTP